MTNRDVEGHVIALAPAAQRAELLGYTIAEIERLLYLLPDETARARALRAVAVAMFGSDLDFVDAVGST